MAPDALLEQLVALDAAERGEPGRPTHGCSGQLLIVGKYLHVAGQLHHPISTSHHIGGMLLIKVRGHRAYVYVAGAHDHYLPAPG